MKTLYIRVQPKQGVQRFYRCGMEFSRAWQEVAVDAATAGRLAAEQMLEVTDTRPAELAAPASDQAAPAGAGIPDDPAERLAAIRAAIALMSMDDASLWTAGGKPKTEAIAAHTGWPVTAAERDAALAEAP